MIHAIILASVLLGTGIMLFLFHREHPDVYILQLARTRTGFPRFGTHLILIGTVGLGIYMALVFAGSIILAVLAVTGVHQ